MASFRGNACASARRAVAVAASIGLADSGLAQPSVTGVELVTGTPATLSPDAFIANLDAGKLVAGFTRWDHDGDGVFFGESFVGFLWTPAAGVRVFDIPEADYFDPQFHFVSEIADNQSVVGTQAYRTTFDSQPFLWTPAGGFRSMPIPRNWTGSASGIAAGGAVAIGEIRDGIGAGTPSQAAYWTIRAARHLNLDGPRGGKGPRPRMKELPSGQPWSSAYDVSADGAVIVGDAGPESAARQATRWLDGVQQPLVAVGSTSSARFTSSDGAIAIGTAVIDEQTVLVRWDAAGAAQVIAPKAGDSILDLNAINAAGTAAVGRLAVAGNPAPFVWTLADGIVVIPELGRELDYDFSEATDVSDDGNRVVGVYAATVVFEGDPPQRGFVWTRSGGAFVIDDLLVAGGFGDLGIFDVLALSADGTRLAATGNPPRQLTDTNSVVITLAP